MIEIPKSNIQLFFDEPTHKYTDDFKNDYTSMTTVVGKYYQHFDSKKESVKYANDYGLNAEEVAQQWTDIKDNSCKKGTKKHNKLETGVKGTSKFKEAVKLLSNFKSGRMFTAYDISFEKDLGVVNVTEFIRITSNRYPRIVKMIQWFLDRGYRFYAEVGVFSFDLLISGQIDLLAIKEDGTFYILDWKTNRNKILWTSGYYKKNKETRELTGQFINQNKRMFYPADSLQDCTGTHYQMQLSGYALLVEQMLNFKCLGIYLVHIQDQYELNEYNMPKKDNRGFYIPIEGAEEIVDIFPIVYIPNIMTNVFKHHYELYAKNKRKTQQAIIF